jgi:hypothetical protein
VRAAGAEDDREDEEVDGTERDRECENGEAEEREIDRTTRIASSLARSGRDGVEFKKGFGVRCWGGIGANRRLSRPAPCAHTRRSETRED